MTNQEINSIIHSNYTIPTISFEREYSENNVKWVIARALNADIDMFLGKGGANSVWSIKYRDDPSQKFALKIPQFNSEGKAILHSRERSLNDPTYVPKIQKILFENGRKVVPPHQVGVIRNRSGERLPFVVEKQIGNGVNSKEHCENYKTRDFKTILEKGLELLLTVKEIRELDLIHNDIKPGNNFVDKNKDFWLGDFDLLINIKDAEKRYEVRKTYSGTPGYISLRADGSQNFQYQDLMSTGASMYYFFTGKKAFKGNNERDQMYNTMGGKYRKLNSFDWISFNKKIVNETSKFLDRLLTPNQSMHFSSPDEAIDSLKNIIDSYK